MVKQFTSLQLPQRQMVGWWEHKVVMRSSSAQGGDGSRSGYTTDEAFTKEDETPNGGACRTS